MFQRETPTKRKNKQDFSSVKYRCPSELDISIHSQDESDNSLHHHYSEEVDVLTEQTWSVPPWQPSDDLQMKQLEEKSFLSPKKYNEEKVLESFESFSQTYQDFKNSISYNDRNFKTSQPMINSTNLINDQNKVQVENKESYQKKEYKENNTFLDISPNEHSNDTFFSSELSKADMHCFYYNRGIETERNYNSAMELQSSYNYHVNDNYINENQLNNLKSELKDKGKDTEINECIENNSSDYVLLKPTNSAKVINSNAEQFSNLNPQSKPFYSVSQQNDTVLDTKFPPSFNIREGRFSINNMNSVAQTLKTLNKSSSKRQQNTFLDYNKDKNPTIPKFEKIIDLNKTKGLVNGHELYENAPFNKCSSKNSMQMVKNNNSEQSSWRLSSKSSVSSSDSENWRQTNNINSYFEKRTLINAEKNVEPSNSAADKGDLDVNNCKKVDFTNASWRSSWSLCQNRTNTFDNSNWRQANGKFSSVELEPAHSSEIVSSKSIPSNIYNWIHAERISPLETPYLKNLDKNAKLSIDITNWRETKIKSIDMDLNTSSDSNNWRQEDSVISQIVKRIIGKRDRYSGKEYLVRWFGTRVDTWEKEDTLTMLHMTALQKYLNEEKQVMDETTKLMNSTFNPGFIDTHCHLDFVFNKLKSTESGIIYRQVCEKEYKFPLSYEGCITCFCDPSTFREMSWYTDFLLNEEVYAAFGCHPHHSNRYGKMEEEYLKIALNNTKTVALGEIGLDYSGRNDHSKELQQEVFKRQLKIAVHVNKPLVIHCRDAHGDCIQILKEIVPSDTRIHRHCFTEPWDKAVEWLSLFKNCFIGITNVISQQSKRGYIVKQVAAKMPLERLLLETDAPYFHPHCLSDDPSGQTRYVSNPGMALYVASEIAKIRGIEIQEVLRHARNNTKEMYGI